MADDFPIDPSGFSLGASDPGTFFPGDAGNILGTGGGGFDWGGSSFPGGFNLGVNTQPTSPGMFDASMFQSGGNLGNPQQSMWDQIWKIINGSQGGQPTQPGATPGNQQQPQQAGLLSSLVGQGLPALGTGAGLTGIIQQMAQGRPTTQQQLRSTVQEGPQQAQLTAQTLGALQNLQGLAQNAELQQAVSRLASGQLPISPDLVKQVTNAFGATAGNLAQGSVENARERGFSGGLDLLSGAGAPQYGQQLAQLQSDVSQALVNLALGLPTTAANIQNSQVANAATPIQLQQGLLGQLQNFAGLQGGQNQTTLGPRPNLLSALQPLGQLSAGLGQMGASRNFFQQQPQQSLSGVSPNLSGQG